jgi:hypothetical protein
MTGNLSRPTGPPRLGQAVLFRRASLLVAWASAGGVLQAFHGKPGSQGRASGSEGWAISHAGPALGSPTRRRWARLGGGSGASKRVWRGAGGGVKWLGDHLCLGALRAIHYAMNSEVRRTSRSIPSLNSHKLAYFMVAPNRVDSSKIHDIRSSLVHFSIDSLGSATSGREP